MEIFELSDKEFSLRKFSEVQENTDWQLNEIRKAMHKQHEKFDNEVAILSKKKKKKVEILELKMQ